MALEVRDPLHGAIAVSGDEIALIDQPAFQRLRHVRQLGFSELSFPGATHTRYLHSLGTMELATRAFDTLFSTWSFADPSQAARLRQIVRLAALLHDLGHAPLSHATEFAMPLVSELGLERLGRPVETPDRRATHEDYTVLLLLDSAFTAALEQRHDFGAAAVAGLIDPALEVDPALYRDGGLDFRPVLSQIISSELDADRMDYLMRDGYFTGVKYGQFDLDWLLSNLRLLPVDGRVNLALDARAIYTFDHFLLARYHMFLMVYFHHRSVAYEQLLRGFLEDGGDGYAIPADPDRYTTFDDAHLYSVLRRSEHPRAQRIVQRRGYRLVIERHGGGSDCLLDAEAAALQDAGIPHQQVACRGVMSKYMREHPWEDHPREPIYVVWRGETAGGRERVEPLAAATDLFDKYSGERQISRLYVPDECLGETRRVLQ
jgi:hypothetical protein